MVECLENLDFANGGNGKSVFLLLGIDALECDNFTGNLVGTDKDTAVRALSDLMFLGKDIDIAQDNRCLDGNVNGSGSAADPFRFGQS